MEQQQFKVSFSVGTKLLGMVLLLLFFSIAFLDISTIFLLEKDKRAYTYQAQSTEALLLGKEFINLARHGLDTLRLSLASVDPLKPITPQQSSALQSVVNNQTEVIGISIELLNKAAATTTVLTQTLKNDVLKELELRVDDLRPPVELMKEQMPTLLKQGFVFLNLSKVGKPPMVAAIIADLSLKDNATGVPIAFGFVSLRGFGKDVRASALTLADREGWVLFDTNPANLFTKKNIGDDPLFEAAIGSQLTAGAQEYESEGTRYLGSYVRPGFELIVLTKTEWRKAMSATYALTEKFLLLGCMAIGAAIIFAMLFAKTMVAPINRLYEATKEVAAGKFDVRLAARSRDEIGALTDSFVIMSRKINLLIEESVKKTQLEHELAIASTVQQTLIPPQVFKNENIYIRSHYQSAEECGGDWWGFFGVGRKMCLMIADATGHGLPSALITASARSCFSVMHKLAQEDPDFSFSPGSMLSYASRVVHDAGAGRIMMTFFLGVLDFDARMLTYASAGHNPPWLFRNSGGKYGLKSLTGYGQRLGEARDVPAYDEQSVEFGPDDILFLYTDGLIEGKNKAGEQYGKKRTRKMVEAALAGGPERLISSLMKDFLAHNTGKPLDDDVTLAAATLLPTRDYSATKTDTKIPGAGAPAPKPPGGAA
jgi:serine phosphatase RsbU (regulator of sigma subunit)